MSALTDVQQALNIVRQSADQAEWDMRLEMLQLTMATAADIVALSRKLAKPKQRTQTKTNLIPQTKVVKRYVDALAPKTAAEPSTKPQTITGTVRPTAPLTPQQQKQAELTTRR